MSVQDHSKTYLPGTLSKALEDEKESTPNNSTNSEEGKIIIHCVRHAQAWHNLQTSSNGGDKFTDPVLIPAGDFQVQKLRNTFPIDSKIALILCSPLARTLQNAVGAFKQLLDRGVPLIVDPSFREFSSGHRGPAARKRNW